MVAIDEVDAVAASEWLLEGWLPDAAGSSEVFCLDARFCINLVEDLLDEDDEGPGGNAGTDIAVAANEVADLLLPDACNRLVMDVFSDTDLCIGCAAEYSDDAGRD